MNETTVIQTKKAIAIIAEYLQRASRNEQLQEAELRGLQECKNIDEWSTAVSYNPGSMGYEVLSTEEAANLVYMACESGDAENLTPVCADAAGRGYLN